MKVTTVLLIEGCVNLLVVSSKVVVALLSGSAVILADAFHSATDLANNVVAILLQRVANKPADKSHPYGHRKFEYLGVFLLAVLLCVLAAELILHALNTLQQPPVQHKWSILILVLAAVASLSVSLFESHWAKKLNSALLKADAKHTMADVLTSLTALVGWQLAVLGLAWLDSVLAMGIAVFVVYLAYGLFRDCVPVLVDKAALDEHQIAAAAKQVPGVVNIHQVRSRSTGEGIIVEIKASVGAHLSTLASHHIADQLEADLSQRFNLLDVIVHIEPS